MAKSTAELSGDSKSRFSKEDEIASKELKTDVKEAKINDAKVEESPVIPEKKERK